jgi:hypothetical protein
VATRNVPNSSIPNIALQSRGKLISSLPFFSFA